MSSPAFDYAARKALESDLDSIAFGRFNLGPCVNDLLHQVQHGRGRWQGWRMMLQNTLQIIRVLVSPVLSLFTKGSMPADHHDVVGRHLFTSVGPLPHYRQMMLRILSRFETNEVMVLGSPFEGDSQAFAPYLFHSRLAVDQRLTWREAGRSFRLLQSAFPILRRFARKHELRSDFIVAILAALSLATVNVSSFRSWLAKARPVSVTTEYDRLSWTAALLKAARSLGIPTMTLQHGAIGGPCWGPLVADAMLCWGQYSQQQLINNDQVPESSICLVGNVLLPDAHEAAERPAFRLLLATNPLAVPVRRRRVQVLAEAVGVCPGVEIQVKLHPSEQVSDYGELPARLPHFQFLDRSAGTGDALLPTVDLLICGNSSLALVAMHLGVPVALFAEDRSELGAAARWLDAGAARFVASAQDLRNVLADAMSGSNAITSQVAKASVLARRQFHAAGGAAAALIEQQIRSRASAAGITDSVRLQAI